MTKRPHEHDPIDFFRTAKAVEVALIHRDAVSELYACADAGNIRANEHLTLINQYLVEVYNEPSDKPMCLHCDGEFTRTNVPIAILICKPFADGGDDALVAGICVRCAAGAADLGEACLCWLRETLPGVMLEILPGSAVPQ